MVSEAHNTKLVNHIPGSYYDQLRVGDAREFDLNLVLDLEVFVPHVKFYYNGDVPGFIPVKCEVENWDNGDELKLVNQFRNAIDLIVELTDSQILLKIH
jgi:hypothetical protein